MLSEGPGHRLVVIVTMFPFSDMPPEDLGRHKLVAMVTMSISVTRDLKIMSLVGCHGAHCGDL